MPGTAASGPGSTEGAFRMADITPEELQRIRERLAEPTAAEARRDLCDWLLGNLESSERLVGCLDSLAERCTTLHTVESSQHVRPGSGTYRLEKVQTVLRALVFAIHDADASQSGTPNHAALDPLWQAGKAVLDAKKASEAEE
jgi:hypothetical protein